MVGKHDAEEIVDLALVPVCTRPDASHGWHGWMLFTALPDTYLQPHKALIGKREKLIDDIKAWNALQPVDRCHRLQKIVVEFLFEIGTDLYQAGCKPRPYRLHNK